MDPLPSLRSPGMTLLVRYVSFCRFFEPDRPERSGGEGKGIHGSEPRLLFPPHRKSGVPDLRKRKPISGKPEMGGEEG